MITRFSGASSLRFLSFSVCLTAVIRLSTLPGGQIYAQNAEQTRQNVLVFERQISQIENEQERSRQLHRFFHALKDRDAKVAAIGMISRRYLSRVPRSMQAELLEPLVSDTNIEVQASAIQTLGYIRMAHGVDTRRQAKLLVSRLGGATPAVRSSILTSLGQMRYPEYAIPVKNYLADPNPAVRAEAAFALALLSAPKVTYITDIAPLLKDADRNVRQRAMSALYQLQTERAVPLIETMLNDPDEYIRQDAINLLVSAKSVSSVSAIAKLREDSSASVQRAARSAVTELTAPPERKP